MKIASDIFLICIKEFLEELGHEKMAGKIQKKLIKHDITLDKKFAKKFRFTKIIKNYLKQHDDLKQYLEKLTKEEFEDEENDEEEEEEEVKPKTLLKEKSKKSPEKRKSFDSSKQKERKKSVEVKETKTKAKAAETTKKVEEDDSDFDINPQQMKAKLNLKIDPAEIQASKLPFKRIDESKYAIKNKVLADNSWEHYEKISGNTMGREANERLKFTAGRDFKKEKTKFKNKSGFGGNTISLEAKSIKLCSDSE